MSQVSGQGNLGAGDTVGGVNIALTVDASTVGPTLQAAAAETVVAAKGMDTALNGVGAAATTASTGAKAAAIGMAALNPAMLGAMAGTIALSEGVALLREQFRAADDAREKYLNGLEKYLVALEQQQLRGSRGTGFAAADEYESQIKKINERFLEERQRVVDDKTTKLDEKERRIAEITAENLENVAALRRAAEASIESEYFQRSLRAQQKSIEEQERTTERIKQITRQRTLDQLDGLDKINEKERQQIEDLEAFREKLATDAQRADLDRAIDATRKAAEFERQQYQEKQERDAARERETEERERQREQREAEAQRRRDEQDVRRAAELANRVADSFNRALNDQLGSFLNQQLVANIERLTQAIELQIASQGRRY